MKAINKKKWMFILPLLVVVIAFAFATPGICAGWRTANR